MCIVRKWLGVIVGLVLLASVESRAALSGESAEPLLTRATEAYAVLGGLEVTALSRELLTVPVRAGSPEPDAPAVAQRLISTSYQQIVFTMRRPDDWAIVSNRERALPGSVSTERTYAFAKIGGSAVALETNPAGGEPLRTNVPVAAFRAMVAGRVGPALRDDVLFGLLFGERGGQLGAAAFGLGNAVVIGEEVENGVAVTRLEGRRQNGDKVTVWLDASSGWVVRSVEESSQAARFGPPGASGGPPGFREGPPRAAATTLRVRETVYFHDPSRGHDKADLDLRTAWTRAAPGIAARANFVPPQQLFTQLGLPEISGGTSESVAGGDVAAPAVNPPAAAAEEQLLTPEQMEAIVIIEGTDGVGTGFLAKIRGVDFVVTNLHVIGGNERISVTTMRGLKIPVSGMFGALGRDIAILRVEGTNPAPTLTISQDLLKTAKLGDKVAVVGNRRGGGVATQASGAVRGVGPDRVEVDARFQPGNSGSPILHVPSGEVIGVASYSMTRRLDMLDAAGAAGTTPAAPGRETPSEQRWFGFRTDGLEKWESIDLVRWREQAKKVEAFADDSEAIYHAMNGRFKQAYGNARVRPVIERFEERYTRLRGSDVAVAQEVTEFFHGLRAIANQGVKELKSGEFYDFFRTSQYWSSSIPMQLRAREELVQGLEKASANSYQFLSRLRR